MKDFYYILGVETNCSSIGIKEAYRKLSKKFHPDLNSNDKYFEGRFREIHEAYVILNDPAQRAIYDRNLKKFKSPPSPGGMFSQQQPTPKPPGSYYRARPTASYKFTTRGIDILFTIILIVITLVFGDYVYKAVNSSKANKIFNAPAVNSAPYIAPAKHYRKKHSLKIKANGDIAKVSSANVSIPTIQPMATPAPVPLPAPVVSKTSEPVQRFLYKSGIHSNLTGIVNMRESDKFSSAVVKEIPTNSEVYVLEKGDTYYKVRFDDVVGYVPKWTVEVK